MFLFFRFIFNCFADTFYQYPRFLLFSYLRFLCLKLLMLLHLIHKSSFLIAAFVTEAAVVNPNEIKIILANSLNIFLLKANQFLVTFKEFYLEILLTASS